MDKKKFQQRFGDRRDKYFAAKNLEKVIKRYLSKYGYELVFFVVNRMLTKEREKRNIEKEIEIAEYKLERLKKSRT